MNTDTKEIEMNATITAQAGIVTITLSDGRNYSTKEAGRWIARLDQWLKGQRVARDGYRVIDGAMVATAIDLSK